MQYVYTRQELIDANNYHANEHKQNEQIVNPPNKIDGHSLAAK